MEIGSKDREAVQLAAKEAGKRHMLAMCHRDTGIPEGSLRAFASKGSMRADKVAIVAKWLKEKGLLEDPSNEALNASEALARQFDAIAALLRSGLPQELKTDAYCTFVDSHGKAVGLWRAELQKG
jgi:hypothetical protein